METKELIKNLAFEYYATQAANPNWRESLWDFLCKRGISPDVIWEYFPKAGREANQPEPDWL